MGPWTDTLRQAADKISEFYKALNVELADDSFVVDEEGERAYVTAGRDAPLYHGTFWRNLEVIFRTNRLGLGKNPVSLTRDLTLAAEFQGTTASNVVLVLDQAKLAQRHKVAPYDDFDSHYRDRSTNPNLPPYEAEERVPRPIQDLLTVLEGVLVPAETLRQLRWLSQPQYVLGFCNAALSMGVLSRPGYASQEDLLALRQDVDERQPKVATGGNPENDRGA